MCGLHIIYYILVRSRSCMEQNPTEKLSRQDKRLGRRPYIIIITRRKTISIYSHSQPRLPHQDTEESEDSSLEDEDRCINIISY